MLNCLFRYCSFHNYRSRAWYRDEITTLTSFVIYEGIEWVLFAIIIYWLSFSVAGRACAVPQTPVSSIAVYANITDPDSTTSHSASMVKKQNGHGSVALLNSINGPTRGPSVEHIVVGDGVEYARVVKTHAGPPPPPPAQKVTQSIAITRMQSIETLEQGAC